MMMKNSVTIGVNNGFKPDPRLTVSEWSDTYRVLTSESSAEAGKWRTDRTPYLREIMDEMSPTSSTTQVKVIKGTQLGFALALDTKIPTPNGFKTMGDLCVGDAVFGSDGKACNVVTKSPIYTDHDCYRLTFDDGLNIDCDGGHRWQISSGEVLNVEDMFNDFELNKYAITNTQPVEDNKGLSFVDKMLYLQMIYHYDNGSDTNTLNHLSYSKSIIESLGFTCSMKDNKLFIHDLQERKIISIVKIPTIPVQCITVDSDNHLFLATESYIPTHNSSIADNIAMCYLDIYPCPILYILPTEGLAKGTSKRRITPSLRAIPKLAKKIQGGKSKDDIGETFTKTVAGGGLTFGWSNSTASFRSFSARIVILDDCDGFGSFAEGDVLELGKARADAFANKKIYINSTPTIEGQSNIETEFEESDQREYDMPCPACGDLMPFKWEYMHYETNDKGRLIGDVACACPNCGYLIYEYEKTNMMLKGVWRPRNEGHIHKGYKLSSFYSPVGWLSWNEIAIEFIKAHKLMVKGDSRLMQVWVNTRDARTFKPQLEGVDITNSDERVEDYGCEVPNDVYILTCGCDTQDDRFELEVLGHAKNGETFSIDYKVIAGDPQFKETQDILDEYLNRTFTRGDGTSMKITGTCIDTGGHRTKVMYDYCKARQNKNVFAIKGANQTTAPITNKTKRAIKPNQLTLFMLGVHTLKDDFYSNLGIIDVGMNYCHFPKKDVYNSKYFRMLTAEKRNAKGVYEKVRNRNEALDCRIYALAVLHILNMNVNKLPRPLVHIGEISKIETPKLKTTTQTYNAMSSHLDEF